MKTTCLFLLICLGSVATIAIAESPQLPLIDLKTLNQDYFQSISVTKSSLLLQFRPSGTRFNYSFCDKPSQISIYGQILELPFGCTLRLSSRHDILTFEPFEGDHVTRGFSLRRIKDGHSVGRSETTNAVFMVLSSSTVSQPVVEAKTVWFIASTQNIAEVILKIDADRNKEQSAQ